MSHDIRFGVAVISGCPRGLAYRYGGDTTVWTALIPRILPLTLRQLPGNLARLSQRYLLLVEHRHHIGVRGGLELLEDIEGIVL